MRLEKQQFIIIIFFTALIAVFAISQYCPLRNQAYATEKVKSAQLAIAEKTEEQIKNLPALEKELQQMQSDLGMFNKRIPDEPMLGAFLKEIADVMNKHSLTEQMVQPDTEVQIGSNSYGIPVKMQCKGTLRDIYEFFISLQSLDRLMKIEQVQLKNDQELSGTVTMVAVGNIYYRTGGLKHAAR